MAAYGPTQGGTFTALDVTVATVIKASGGSINTVFISGSPSAGSLTINDCATTGAASAANQIASIPYGALTALPINFNFFPTQNGIVISSVPTGAVIAIAYS